MYLSISFPRQNSGPLNNFFPSGHLALQMGQEKELLSGLETVHDVTLRALRVYNECSVWVSRKSHVRNCQLCSPFTPYYIRVFAKFPTSLSPRGWIPGRFASLVSFCFQIHPSLLLSFRKVLFGESQNCWSQPKF